MSSQTPNEPRALPHAGRPRGAAWRALQAEGIEWEAQVLIGSGEKTLSARLVVTTERLAFARGGDVVLDIDRRWLTRPPYLNGDGTINLAIDTGSGHRERLQFGARDGRAIATDFVNLLTHGPEAIAEAPMEARFSRVPERKRSSLPADPAFPTELVPAAGEHTYSRDVIDATTMQVLDPTDFPPLTEAASPTTNLRNAPEGGRGSSDPITISTLANQNHRSGQWSLAPMANTVPATQGISRAGWAFRLSGLVLLLALAAAFGTDRLPHIPGMPSRDTFIAAPNTNAATEQALAQVVATATSTEPSMSEQATTAAEQTAVALGVGSEAAFLTPTATLAPAEPTETATETLTAGEAQGGYLPAEEPTETATLAPTETETLVPTDMPTETSVPVDTATLEPTIAEPTATETVIAEDTATETALPEATATETLIPTETTVPSATEVPT
ncbi:MAG TPA: hypothetical protein PK819_02910, partial [Thermomicrobiales bacterium]|nr:hypothetical protein [Thermomicrobiales bacterium]